MGYAPLWLYNTGEIRTVDLASDLAIEGADVESVN
jgi:hypothetical protein